MSRIRISLLVAVAIGALVIGGVVCCGAAQRPDGGVGLLPQGRMVPDLTAVDHTGTRVSLRQISATSQMLVYFYPKDGTPGCTKEACAIRDAWARYQKAGIVVLGVSADSAESHREFAREHSLPFSLVSDENGSWARAFGVGSFFGMHSRVSFLVDRGGSVRRVYDDVDPGVHATRVLEDAR